MKYLWVGKMYRTIREMEQLKNPSYDLGRYISPETPNFKVNSGVKSDVRGHWISMRNDLCVKTGLRLWSE